MREGLTEGKMQDTGYWILDSVFRAFKNGLSVRGFFRHAERQVDLTKCSRALPHDTSLKVVWCFEYPVSSIKYPAGFWPIPQNLINLVRR